MSLRYDINHENLAYYFGRRVSEIGQHSKELLPKDILYKIFDKKGKYRPEAGRKLNFLSKLFVLTRAVKSKWYLVIEDEENGIGVEQFLEKINRQKNLSITIDNAEELGDSGAFVLGNAELIQAFAQLNNLSLSPAYNYISKFKQTPLKEKIDWGEQAKYVLSFLTNFETVKKRIVKEREIQLPELYILLYLYDGISKPASSVYKVKYANAYNASKSQFQKAFGSLQAKGLVEKKGPNKIAQLKITALGISLVDEILCKYLINC